ncbi:MAG: SpoIID/LytB domain-containing protein, partial [Candidatus Latescibacterota bacterium]
LFLAAAVLAAAFLVPASCTPRPPAGRPNDEWTTWTGKKEARPGPAPKPAEKERARGHPRRFEGGRPLGPLRVALRIDALALEVTLPRGGRIAWEGGEIPIGEGGSVRFALSEGAVELRGPTEPRVLPSPVHVLPDGAEPWLLERKPYAGTLSLVAGKGGLVAVNGIGLEDYLRGVVPWEIGWLPAERVEALKAQAIAARTYALSRVAVAEEGSLWDLVATESDQVYRGLERTDPVVDRAIDETAGLVAVHDDELIRAYYSSTCGGRTAPVPDVWIDREPAPYLRSVRDAPGGSDSPSRAYCRDSPHFRWKERWKGEEIDAVLRNLAAEKGQGPAALGRLRDVRIEETGETGRALRTVFETERADLLVEADRIRWVLRRPGGAGILRSAWITLDVKRSKGFVVEIVAEGRGHGHGVGMCQWGAIGMADEGHRFEEILRHYYKGVRLEEASRALAGGAG